MCSGEISVMGADKLEITELPIGTWTQAYKESVLEVMLHGEADKKPSIITYVPLPLLFVMCSVQFLLQKLLKTKSAKVT